MQGFLRGVLATAAGIVTGNNKAPILGMTEDGQIFANAVTEVLTLVVTAASVTDTTSEAIAANASRKSIEFFNADTVETIFLNFEGEDATASDWPLLPQAFYSPPSVTRGQVNAINGTASATASLRIVEGE